MRCSIEIDIINAVLTYMGSRPYAEVFRLIADVQADAKEISEVLTKKPVDDDEDPGITD